MRIAPGNRLLIIAAQREVGAEASKGKMSVTKDPSPPDRLYRQLLAADWGQLHETLRRFHGDGMVVRAAGTFRVRRGRRPLACPIGWFMRLPAAGEDVPLELSVTPLDGGQQWRRTFAGRLLVSTQSIGSDGLLAERIGPVEMHFELRVSGDSLRYRCARGALYLGRVRIGLPEWLTPRVIAREQPAGGTGQVEVTVEASFPWVGLVISYEGVLARIEEDRC